MIRPLTIATCLLACGSGLYLYQSKHEVQLLDRTIERTVHDTNALREQSRLLAAEWTMLNDPGRLRQFSDSYLTLKTITPSQFTSPADLDSRLPQPPTEPPQTETSPTETSPADALQAAAPDGSDDPESTSVMAADAPQTVSDPAATDETLPVPPMPAAPPAAIASRAVDPKAADRVPPVRTIAGQNQARPTAVADARPSDPHSSEQQRVVEQRPSDPRLSDQRPPDQRLSDQRPGEPRGPVRVADARATDPRPTEQRGPAHLADARADGRTAAVPTPRPIVLGAARPAAPSNVAPSPALAQPAAQPAAGYTGSLLGMARGAMPPAPRPTPVNAAYNGN